MSKLPPGIKEATNYSYLDALYERRSRRFAMGGEIDEGPLKFKSKHKPIPLSEIEEAILVWNGLGIKNINLSDFPPHKGLDLEVKFMSKTIASLGDIHRTELFYTNENLKNLHTDNTFISMINCDGTGITLEAVPESMKHYIRDDLNDVLKDWKHIPGAKTNIEALLKYTERANFGWEHHRAFKRKFKLMDQYKKTDMFELSPRFKELYDYKAR